MIVKKCNIELGVVVDGCPAGLPLSADDIQTYLNRRRPGQSRHAGGRGQDSIRIEFAAVNFNRSDGQCVGGHMDAELL